MSIENRNLEAGMTLVATYKKEEYRVEVISGDNGKVKFKFPDGREFKSPSAAGTAITSLACNGWKFWTSVAAIGQPGQLGQQEETTAVAEPEPEAESDHPEETTAVAEPEPEAESDHPEETTAVAEPEPETESDHPEETTAVTPANDAEGEDSPEDQDTEPDPPHFRRVANQVGVGSGYERLFCDSCGSSFVAILGEQPDQCPEGHEPQASGNWVKK